MLKHVVWECDYCHREATTDDPEQLPDDWEWFDDPKNPADGLTMCERCQDRLLGFDGMGHPVWRS